MVQSISNVLSNEIIENILNLSEVQKYKIEIDKKDTGSVYFSIELDTEIKQQIKSSLGLNLDHIEKIPMRWIKGDTRPHIDRGIKSFQNTYLIYLTDSLGEFIIGENSYSITKGTGFVFEEGLYHETKNTNLEPRLLLGPMSEKGFAVGSGISLPGGTILYIRQLIQPAGVIEYSIDQINWNTAFFNFNLSNSDTSLGFVKVYFITDITLNNNSDYFVLLSEYIQFGNETLNPDGSRPTITITVDNWDGFIANGDILSNGYSNIYIYNLNINGSGHTTQIGAGWVAKKYFGIGATNNYIINCSSSGDITDESGGIVGHYAAYNGGVLFIKGCSSSGVIRIGAGGIAGAYCGDTGGIVNIESCWSTGNILAGGAGDGAGGIIGYNSTSANIINCYSSGLISGTNSGGIVGSNAGTNLVEINNCYSEGDISGDNSGGICGSFGIGTYSVQIGNCYTVGDLNASFLSGGISGLILGGTTTLQISNCYTSGNVSGLPGGYIIGNVSAINGSGSGYVLNNNYSEAGSGGTPGIWSDTHANSTLISTPSGGYPSTWATNGQDIPYILFNMGYTPYSATNISGTSLVRTSSSSISAGNSTNSAINAPGPYYAFLEDYSSLSITINNADGSITTSSSTVPGVYTLYIYSSGSYHITTFTLTVSGSGYVPCLLKDTLVLTPTGYTKVQDLQKEDYVVTSDQRKVNIKSIFDSVINQTTEHTYPCKIKQNSIAMNYPSEDLYISQTHLIKHGQFWILPKMFFEIDSSFETVHYYHIALENYKTDHLVINNGFIVESLGIEKDDGAEYDKRAQDSILLSKIKEIKQTFGNRQLIIKRNPINGHFSISPLNEISV